MHEQWNILLKHHEDTPSSCHNMIFSVKYLNLKNSIINQRANVNTINSEFDSRGNKVAR